MVEPNYDLTFERMFLRKMERGKYGTVKSKESIAVVILVCSGMIFFSFANIFTYKKTITTDFDLTTNISLIVLGILSIISVNLTEKVKYITLTLILGLATSLIFSTLCVIFNESGNCRNHVLITSYITISFICLIFMYEKILYVGNFLSYKLYRIKCWKHDEETGFHILKSYFSKNFEFFSYKGSYDENGRPHGYGEWINNSKNGENLKGIWKHGIPIGPFKSIDYRRGYITESVLIGFIHNRQEDIDEYWYRCIFDPDGTTCGVYSVECSKAGKFFRNLPKIEQVVEEKNTNLYWVMENMVKFPSKHHESISITMSENGLCANGSHNSLYNNTITISENDGCLSAYNSLGENILYNSEKEIVIFVHGFNSPVSDALKRMGQLWSLGEFPQNIYPIVYGWPGSKSYAYFTARECIIDERNVDDFCEMITSICNKKINLLIHSMGCELIFEALRKFYSEDVNIKFSTVTLLNPDSNLDIFNSQEYKYLDYYSEMTTIYADHRDNALWYSEFFNRFKALGKHPFKILGNIDVIDVSWMENNMHNMRHNFFDLNKLVVDDLREIIVNKKRALYRKGLLYRKENVWSFLSPPKDYVNK